MFIAICSAGCIPESSDKMPLIVGNPTLVSKESSNETYSHPNHHS